VDYETRANPMHPAMVKSQLPAYTNTQLLQTSANSASQATVLNHSTQ